MTENNKQAEGTDTKAKANYDTAIFAGASAGVLTPHILLKVFILNGKL